MINFVSGNGLGWFVPRNQAITQTIVALFSIGPLWTKFGEMWAELQLFVVPDTSMA